MRLPSEGAGRERDWEFGISRCKLLYLEWVNTKVLPNSTGTLSNSGINHNRTIFFNVYMYITELLCCTAAVGTTS